MVGLGVSFAILCFIMFCLYLVFSGIVHWFVGFLIFIGLVYLFLYFWAITLGGMGACKTND